MSKYIKVLLLVSLFSLSACDNIGDFFDDLSGKKNVINNPPTSADLSVSTDEDIPLVTTANASDPDGDELSFFLSSNVTNGVLKATTNGNGVLNLTYKPNENFNGNDSFEYTVSDGTTSTGPYTVSITVNPVNDAPVSNNASVEVNSGENLAGNLNATDVDGDTLTYAVVNNPANGNLTVDPDGSYNYQSNPGFNGSDQFTFVANDGNLDSNIGTVSINVLYSNAAPSGMTDSYATAEDTPLSVTAPGVLGNDSDVNGDSLAAVLLSAPANGAVSLSADGSFTFIPNANFNGMDSFTYVVNDGALNSPATTVSILVNAVNDLPVATDQAVTLPEDTSANIVLAGSDLDGDALTFAIASAPVNGALSGLNAATGAVTYTPNPDFNGTDSFTFMVNDGVANSAIATVALTITAVNDSPTAILLDNSAIDENQAAGTLIGILTTVDVDATDTHTYALVAGAGDADNASFAIVADQIQSATEFDFETQASYSIRVQTTDSAGGLFAQAFTVSINDLNDAPTDIALSNTSIDENQPAGTAVGTMSSTDTDSAGPFVYALVAGAGDTDNASFAIAGDQLQSAATFDFETQNSFSIRIQTDDGAGGTFEEAFTITVNDLNDAPTDIALSNSSVDENQPAGTAVGTFSATDADSAAFTYTLVAGAGDTDNAFFTIAGDQLQSAAVFDFETQNSYSIRVQTDDGAGGTFEEAFTITVNDLNDAPTDIALSNSSVDENQPAGTAVGTLSSTDVDSAAFTYTLVAGAGDTDNASFALVGDQLQSAAVFDFEIQDSFSVRVQTDDGAGGTFEKAFTITVNDLLDPNAAPVAATDTYTGGIGNTNFALVAALSGTSTPPTVQLVGTVIGNDTDADTGDTLSATPDATIPTTQGGSVAIDANGRFVYTPAAGFPSATVDSFDYEVCDDGTPSMCDTGTVTITGSDIVWYVDDSSPNNPGSGTAADPFRTLASAGGPSLPGDTIFVFSGTQTTGIGLQNNQSLLGEGVPLVVNATTLVNGGTRPVIANATGAAIMLASGNTVRGLDITNSTAGVIGSGIGSLTLNTMAISTTTGTALSLDDGNAVVTLDSVSSSTVSANPVISLTNTGAGAFSVTGSATTAGSGGTIANKAGDAIVLSNTAGPVTLKNMIMQDIGDTAGGFDTRSQHDAIHGQTVSGGLTLDNMIIRRVSDMCINGVSFDGFSATTWTGLEILNSTIEDCNRWHVAGTGDTFDEGAVRIVGITGTVTVDGSVIQRGGVLLDLFTADTGTLTMNVTNSTFSDAFKEFTSGGTVAIGKSCINVTVEGSADANVTIGGPGAGNTFVNCANSSIRVVKDTSPAGTSDIVFVIDNNTFRVTDHTPANGVFGNTPQGGVALRAGPGAIGTFDAVVSNNSFGVAVGPDDDVGSTTDEIANADGVGGNLALIFEQGVSQVRVNDNTFNGSINAPWANRADGNTSAAVLYENNNYRGRADYCCDSGFTFRVPGIPYRTQVRNNGNLDITFRNDQFAVHDQFFFFGTETLEFESRTGGGTMCIALDNVSSPDGYEFDELVGSINLYQGQVNNAATGPCGVAHVAPPGNNACEAELADDGVRGGADNHDSASGTPTASLNPPHVDIDNGSIEIVAIPCMLPSGGIF